MDLVSCSRCGKLHPRGYKCTYGRKADQSEEAKLRRKNSWKEKAKEIKKEALYLCEVCKDEGIYTYDGLEVHHITKLKDDPNGLLDDNNLICLCIFHHKKADAGEIKEDYLRKLVKKRYEQAEV